MSNQSHSSQIYVALLEEGVDVWRPVVAEQIRGDIFQISLGSKADPDEIWEFQPGDFVRCEEKIFECGSKHMTAVEQVRNVI